MTNFGEAYDMKISRVLCSFCLGVCGWAGSVAVSNLPAAELLRGPYLQMTTPTGATIRWRTDVASESIVFYGVNASNLHLIAGDFDPTTEHEIQLEGLEPESRYFYAIGSLDESLAAGPDYFFITHPPPGRPRPTRVWAIGDCGTANTGAGNQVGVRNA